MRWTIAATGLALLCGCDSDSPTSPSVPEETRLSPAVGGTSSSPNQHENFRFNSTMVLWNPCTSEPALMEGRIHVVVKWTADDPLGTASNRNHSTAQWSGTGLYTGIKYRLIQQELGTYEQDSGGYSYTYDMRYRVIAQGAASDFVFRTRYSAGFDPATGWFFNQEKYEFECT